MPKYLFKASYTQAGIQSLIQDGGTSRKEMVDNLISEAGGCLEVFYFAFGDDDLYVIADLPDDATAAALSLAVGAAGSVGTKTTVLVTPETVDEAVKKAVSYRPPGSQ